MAESCCDRCADSFRNFDFVFKDPLLNSEVSISAISEFLLIQFIEEKSLSLNNLFYLSGFAK